MENKFDELESQLRSRPSTWQPEKLRTRVMKCVSAELALEEHRSAAAQPFGNLYWLAAAAALIAMGFSMVTASQDGFASSSRHRDTTMTDISLIQQLENQTDGSLK